MTLLDAARQALRELEGLNESPHLQDCFHAFDGEIAALRQAIDQAQQCVMENAQGDLERISLVQTGVGIGKPEQEPVALDGWVLREVLFDNGEPLGHRKPQRKPLTDEEIALIVGECAASAYRHDDFSFARAIERAHGIGGGE